MRTPRQVKQSNRKTPFDVNAMPLVRVPYKCSRQQWVPILIFRIRFLVAGDVLPLCLHLNHHPIVSFIWYDSSASCNEFVYEPNYTYAGRPTSYIYIVQKIPFSSFLCDPPSRLVYNVLKIKILPYPSNFHLIHNKVVYKYIVFRNYNQ